MSSDDERTIACKLDEARKEKRRPKVEALFVNELLERHEIESGWEFQFPADDPVLERVFEFVNAERKCCPFFQFQVFVDPDGGPTAPKTDTSAGDETWAVEYLARKDVCCVGVRIRHRNRTKIAIDTKGETAI
jgi:hypothetical protein